jgi:AcrR family transcriptional regulator
LSEPALANGGPGLAGFHGSLSVAIGYARPERVIGEMKIGARHRARDGTIHLGAVVGFASELVANVKPCRADVLGGEAVALHPSEGLMTWQASIFDAAGQVAAIVSLTLLIADVASASTAVLAPPDLAAAETIPLRAKGRTSPTSVKGKDGATSAIAEARRDQIASAASDVIARKGFANATIREIADAAGLHVPTLYQHVASKDEVLELVYRWAMEQLRTDVDEATAGCATAREKITATVRAMLANGDRHKRLVGVLNRELKSLQPVARQRVLDEYQALLRRIADLIEDGVATGEFRAVDPFIAANFVEGLTDLWPLRQFAFGKGGLEAFQRQAVSFIVAGLSGGYGTAS